ncbi:MAG: MlaD family protein [Armatimonadota bacterium]|nr:MlaD family protein [bacterium]
MRLRNEAKVGLIVFASLVLLVGVYWFLGGFSLRASTYPIYGIFANAQKLEKGADVRMAGVKIGVVSDVVLTSDSNARVNMLIWNGTCIPMDSAARITTGAFVGDFYVEIVPGRESKCVKPDQMVKSAQIVQFDQLMAEAGDLLVELKTTAKGINKVLSNKEMLASVTDTIKAIKTSAESASTLINTAQGLMERSSPEIERTFANLADASGRAVGMCSEIQNMLAHDVRPNVKPLLGKTNQAMDDLIALLDEATTLVSSLGENSGSVKEMLQRANGAALQAEEMLANLNSASASVKGLATDPEFLCNIKATARNAADASGKASLLMDKLNKKLGGSGPTPLQKSEIPQYGVSGDGLWNTAKGKYRFDANYTFALSEPMFARAGLYSIGESTKVNLQAGNTLGQSGAARYGLYASRLGVGYDYRLFNRRVLISTDLFRPDEPQLEMRGIFGIGDNMGLYAGVQDLLHKDDRDLMLGIAYQQ